MFTFARCAVADSTGGFGGGWGGKKHEIYVAFFDDHLFYDLFLQGRRVPTRPGKPGKMRVQLENLEISWNFEKFNKYHGKMT